MNKYVIFIIHKIHIYNIYDISHDICYAYHKSIIYLYININTKNLYYLVLRTKYNEISFLDQLSVKDTIFNF